MADVNINKIYQDIRALKRDLEVIKYILSEEGQLTEKAKKKLIEARKTSLSDYIALEKLK